MNEKRRRNKNLVLSFARSDGRVRAVLLNGSRANPKFEADHFQDFDILLVVENLESFTADHAWTNIFGKKIISQMPDEMDLGENYSQEKRVCFAYLMRFEDGNRIDLTLFPKNKLATDFQPDSLTILWLDKDDLFPNIPPPSDKDYWYNTSVSEHPFVEDDEKRDKDIPSSVRWLQDGGAFLHPGVAVS